MKKKVSFALGLLSVTGFMMSCAKENISWENFKLENISDYSAIGFAAFSSEKKQTKTRRSGKQNKNEEITDIQACTLGSLMEDEYTIPKVNYESPFILAGFANDKVEKLGFKNGNNESNFTIDYFGNVGDFIFFHPFSENSDNCFEENGKKGYRLYSPFHSRSLKYIDVPFREDCYLLSKKSGKIYKYSEDFDYFRFWSGGGVMYVLLSGNNFDSTILYKVVEENESLNFVGTKIPSSYIQQEGYGIDKYGNFLTSKGIITTDMKNHEFTSYFGGGSFVLNGEDEIVYFSDDCLTSYVLDSNGEFVESDNALRGLCFGQTGYQYNSNMQVSKEDYLKEIVNYFSDSSPYVYLTYNKSDCIVGTNGVILENGGESNFKKVIYQNEEYAYDQHMQRYLLDERGFYIFDDAKGNNIISSAYETILRGNSVYYYQNSELHKFDMSTEIDEMLSLDYTITSLGVDEYGRITVDCLDDSFNQFVGYLEMDDTISLEAKEVSEVSNYVLYPVN